MRDSAGTTGLAPTSAPYEIWSRLQRDPLNTSLGGSGNGALCPYLRIGRWSSEPDPLVSETSSLSSSESDPELPDPELPDPELPDPELPDPELPDPEASASSESESSSTESSLPLSEEDEDDVFATVASFDQTTGLLTLTTTSGNTLAGVVNADTELEWDSSGEGSGGDASAADLIPGAGVTDVDIDKKAGAFEEVELARI